MTSGSRLSASHRHPEIESGAPAGAPHAEASAGGLRILAIEDNPFDQRILLEELRDVVHPESRIAVANSLGDGLACIARDPFDVVLLDLDLPDCERWEGLARVRALDEFLPVVLLTGANDIDIARECLKRGAQDYLIKGQAAGKDILRALEYAIVRHGAYGELSRVAATDPLTGIANRLHFADRLGQALRHARRVGELVALHVCDLNGFKRINDEHGHPAGDAVLREVARRMASSLRDNDSLFRLGGDEFSLIQSDLATPGGARILIEKVVAQFQAPFAFEAESLTVSLSAGVALFPKHAEEAEALIAKADAALYRAKKTPGGGFVFA